MPLGYLFDRSAHVLRSTVKQQTSRISLGEWFGGEICFFCTTSVTRVLCQDLLVWTGVGACSKDFVGTFEVGYLLLGSGFLTALH